MAASKLTRLAKILTLSSAIINGIGLIAHAETSQYQTSIQLQSQSSFSRVQISIDPSFKPIVHSTVKGFEIVIPAATLMDVGVPFGGEDEFREYLSKLHDSRISGLKIAEKDSNLVISGHFSFPTGSEAMASPEMEHFDFHQNDKSKYLVDFWLKKGLTVAEVARQKKIKDAKKLKSEQEEILARENARSVERERRMGESKNALLFCQQPFDRNNTVFLKFHSSHQPVNFGVYFPEKVPDHRFVYAEPKGESEESQMVRLALKLSRDNQHALAMKTVEFLEKQYPKSKWLTEMSFLKASSYYRLEMTAKGKEAIHALAASARGTEIGIQAAAFEATQALKEREWLAALNAFMNIHRENPHHPLDWLFRLGMAESLYQIRQSDQARTEYEWVSKNAPKLSVRAEAAFKVGDIFFDRGQYALSITAYNKAIKEFESSQVLYPFVVLNLAESYFQLEEFEKAEKTFLRYLEIGSNYPNAWRASLRVAEIRALNLKHSPETEVAFMETVNRFPMTPGAVVARLRLIPCGNHGGFDLAGAQRFIFSPAVEKFDGGEDMYASSFHELVGLTEVRMLLSFGDDQLAMERGVMRLQENPAVEVRKLIEQAMIGGIMRYLDHLLNEGKGYTAIATYEKWGDYLPLPSHDPMADELRLRLARFASEKKLSTFALKLIEPYRIMNEVEHREQLAAIQKNLNLESNEEQDERNFIEVKTMWNSEAFKTDDAKESDLFLTRLASVRDDSAYTPERDLLKILYLHEKKEDQKALELALVLTKHMTRFNSSQKGQVWAWIGDLARELKKPEVAGHAYHEARVASQKASEKKQPELEIRHLSELPSTAYLYLQEGEMLDLQQKWKDSVALYTEAIENKVGGNHVLYAHARAILKEGGRDSKNLASRSLEKIKQSQEDDVWKSLAQKGLEEIAKEGKTDDTPKPR